MSIKQSKPASVSENNRQLILSQNSLNFEYQARLSHLVTFLETEPQSNSGYEQSLGFLAQRVRDTGSKLITIHGQLSYSPAQKSDIEAALYFCSLLTPPEPLKLTRVNSAPACLKRPSSFTHLMSAWTCNLNRPRLYFVYAKKFFDVLSPLAKSVVFYQQFVSFIDELNPYLSIIAWVFYAPRLLVNLFLLAKHSIAGSWMSEDERALGMWVRLVAEWSRLWQEILNDAVWCTVGILCCFVLSSPTALLLTVGLYSFDFAMALTRLLKGRAKHREALNLADIELKALEQKLEKSTDETEKNTLQVELKDLKVFNAKLLEWTHYEQRLLKLGINVTTGLSLGMVFSALPLVIALPSLAATLLPIVGVVLILVVRSLQLAYLKQIGKSKPNTNLESSKVVNHLHVPGWAVNHRLFTPVPSEKVSIRKVESEPRLVNN